VWHGRLAVLTCWTPRLPRPSQIVPVAWGCVLAYSCAAARDLHPLPCPLTRTREPVSKASRM